MSARRKASCTKTLSHYGFVTLAAAPSVLALIRVRQSRQARYRVRSAAACTFIARRSATSPMLKSVRRTGPVAGIGRRTVVGDRQPADDDFGAARPASND